MAALRNGSATASRSLRLRLFALIAAIVLPAMIAFSLLIFDLYRHERAAKERQLFETARAVSTAVDANLGQGWVLLDSLARSKSLETEDWRALDEEARRITPPEMEILLTSPARGQLVNTRVPRGTPLPHDYQPDDQRRWADLLVRKRIVSDLYYGRLVHTPIVALSVLVSRRGQPAYELSLLIDPRVQDRLLASQGLPKGWIAGLMDRNAVQIARAPAKRAYIGLQGTAPMADLVLRGEEGVANTISRTGVPMVSAYARSRTSSWTTLVAAPRAEFLEGLTRSLSLALAVGAVFLIVGVMLSLGLSRRVLGAVAALVEQARAVGERRPAPAVATGLAETDQVSNTLATAAEEIANHESVLNDLNAGLEARVQEATERLVQAQKMETLGQLTGGVAHDFNNLLTAVLGNLHLLARTTLDERQARFVAGATAAGERGARLTAQLLAFTRRQRLLPEAVDLNDLVAQMGELLSTTLGSAVHIVLSPSAEAPLATADRTQLELAVLNLAINGRDAMPGGGVLTVSVDEITLDGQGAGEGAPPPGHYAVVTVADTGEGMTPEVRRRALEPFFTTKGAGRGSGLGLPQVLGMAHQLGGGLIIDSQPGAGAKVSLLLPMAANQTAAAAVAEAPRGQDVGPLKILLVDDDDSVRAATAGLLAELGCTVTQAVDGPAALAAIGSDVELVIVDFTMPGMNGAELASRLRRTRPGLPILIITGYADPDRLTAGWDGPVLAKPFDFETLAAAVRKTVGRPGGDPARHHDADA